MCSGVSNKASSGKGGQSPGVGLGVNQGLFVGVHAVYLLHLHSIVCLALTSGLGFRNFHWFGVEVHRDYNVEDKASTIKA